MIPSLHQRSCIFHFQLLVFTDMSTTELRALFQSKAELGKGDIELDIHITRGVVEEEQKKF